MEIKLVAFATCASLRFLDRINPDGRFRLKNPRNHAAEGRWFAKYTRHVEQDLPASRFWPAALAKLHDRGKGGTGSAGDFNPIVFPMRHPIERGKDDEREEG